MAEFNDAVEIQPGLRPSEPKLIVPTTEQLRNLKQGFEASRQEFKYSQARADILTPGNLIPETPENKQLRLEVQEQINSGADPEELGNADRLQ